MGIYGIAKLEWLDSDIPGNSAETKNGIRTAEQVHSPVSWPRTDSSTKGNERVLTYEIAIDILMVVQTTIDGGCV